jgi:hypothetical protein
MRKADFRNEGKLNKKNIQIVCEERKDIINELLRIMNEEEFIKVFDEDEVK